jgi:hypothetical protein
MAIDPQQYTPPHPLIAQLGIMTADRPLLLKRALTSYILNTRDRGQIEYVVFDDSSNEAGLNASREVGRELRREYDVKIRFAGRNERAAYVRRLCEYTGASPAILGGALLVENGYTLGQNRNALLLDTAGVSCFCADDDTLCTPVSPPVIETSKIKLSSGEDPSDYWCFADPIEARAVAKEFEVDCLTAHEELLGKTIGELDGSVITGASLGYRNCPGRLQNRESRVRITFNGLVGDCGWGTPFGLWHEPMGYLAFARASLQRLISSEEFYQQAILSRQLLRVTTCKTISDFSFSMLTFCGLDNRKMLPPNPPRQRGQDLVFGQILLKCFEGILSGHVPLALGHDPVPARRFWPGEITRTAAGVDLCRLLIEAIGGCEFQSGESTAGERIQALGRHFLRIAGLPVKSLAEFFKKRLSESNRRFRQGLMARVESLRCPGGGYAADVGRYFNKLDASQVRENYWVPLDLWSINGAASAVRQLRQNLTEFGQLLDVWPDIFEAAKSLRRDGVRLSVPV